MRCICCSFYICVLPPAACLFRYNALSFVYLIYLLLIPLFAEPTSTTMQGKSRCVTPFKRLWFHSFGFAERLEKSHCFPKSSRLKSNAVFPNVKAALLQGAGIRRVKNGLCSQSTFRSWKLIALTVVMIQAVRLIKNEWWVIDGVGQSGHLWCSHFSLGFCFFAKFVDLKDTMFEKPRMSQNTFP